MSNAPVIFSTSNGLNLQPDPIEVGGAAAVDLLNVDFDVPGRTRTRDGYASVFTKATVDPFGLVAFNSSSQLVSFEFDGAHKYRAYDGTGTLVAATLTPASYATGWEIIGTSAAIALYVANGTDTLWKWNGAAWSQPAALPTARYLSQTTSNRLVAGGHATTGSRVAFSDAGAPETFGANNFVDLTPGDGAAINGLVAWQNDVYAFKWDRFFVFYGESTAAAGTPIFNYRRIEGYGASFGMCAAGLEGVYFFDGRSVWLTQGGTPVKVSKQIDSYLQRLATLNGTTRAPAVTAAVTTLKVQAMNYVFGRLYLTIGFGTGANGATLVYDPRVQQWTYYGLNLAATTVFGTGADSQMYSAIPTTSGGGGGFTMAKFDGSTADAGSAISWSWKSGKYPLATGRVASTQESNVFGTGTVTLALDADLTATQSGSVTLGTSPIPAVGWLQKDTEGHYFQHTLSGSGPATFSRVTHLVSVVDEAEHG